MEKVAVDTAVQFQLRLLRVYADSSPPDPTQFPLVSCHCISCKRNGKTKLVNPGPALKAGSYVFVTTFKGGRFVTETYLLCSPCVKEHKEFLRQFCR